MFKVIEMTGQTVEEAVNKALSELGADRSEVSIDVLDEGDQGGFLGFGRRPAKVRVTDERVETEEVTETPLVEEAAADAEVTAEQASVEADEPLAEDASDDSDDADVNEDSDDEDEDEETGEAGDLDSLKSTIETTIHDFLVAIQENMKLANEVSVHFDGKTLVVDIDGDDCGILIGRRGATLRSMQYLTSLYTNRLAGTRVELKMDIGGYRRKREDSVVDLAKRTADKALRTGNAFELNPMGSNDRRIVHEALSSYEGIVTYSEGEEPGRYVVIDLAAAMPDSDESYEAADEGYADDEDLNYAVEDDSDY